MPAFERLSTQFLDDNGDPLLNGKLYVGVYGLDPVANPITIYSDVALTTPLTNPQTLDSFGRPTNDIYIGQSFSYKVEDSGGTQIELKNVDFAPYQGLSLRAFGAIGDGVTDDTAAVTAWLNALDDDVSGYVPSGTYLITSTISIEGITNHVRVVCDPGVVFKLAAINTPMFTLKGSTAKTVEFTWQNGTFDTSLGTFVSADQSSTALDLTRWYRVNITGAVFTTKTQYDAATKHGDSGITMVDCWFTNITHCHFFGQPDAGIYISGNSDVGSADDGGFCNISDNSFEYCQQAATIKRQMPGMMFNNNQVYRCYEGISSLEVSTVGPGVSSVISNNFFKFIENQPMDIRGHVSGGVISANRIEDWGFKQDGVTPGSSTPAAILLQGCSEMVISGNEIRMNDWTAGISHRGVSVIRFTHLAVDYDCAHNLISGNLFKDCGEGIEEADVNQGPTIAMGNVFVGVNDPIEYLNSNSIAMYSDDTELGDGIIKFQIGSNEYPDFQVNDSGITAGRLQTTNGGTLTIASGAITATTSFHKIDTEGAASSDDLDTINGGLDGYRLVIRPNADARTIVVKDGTGNIHCNGDFTMDSEQDAMELIYDTNLSAWMELSRSDNGV